MKKVRCLLGSCLLAAGAAQAAVIDLDLPAAGAYSNATVILTSQSYNGATFAIAYTVDATAGVETTSDVAAYSTGSQLGVKSVADGATDGHWVTLEGEDDERLSFTSLSIVNFEAGTSGLAIDDIVNLRFIGLSLNNTGNQRDGINVSFAAFETDTANINLSSVGTETTIDLTALSNYNSPETALYIENDSASSSDRWAVTGLQVAYTIPEPATLGLVVASAGGLLVIRRRFMI
ncbi:PEP-CTERM sorting domain-containing protein [Pontiella sp.]|uniref:PEP-CTERM sorting domain-containing protein n=1 Tax=Pontiella sp. TaxID=2837462 RepID=UPI0035651512